MQERITTIILSVIHYRNIQQNVGSATEQDLKKPHVRHVAVQELQEKPVLSAAEQGNKDCVHHVPEPENPNVRIVREQKKYHALFATAPGKRVKMRWKNEKI